ncbi:F-box protein At5g07610-like [Bidens hawaiensis]|uniref:F-box protein At5g07610-like n=1 Tax=Bidens hawaiensis TaxID=980011 RepID=UPI00404B21A3
MEGLDSGSLIGSNDDLLIEISVRLPLKSVLRFKSVSKHWLWLLSHRRFTLRYDNNNNNLPKSLGLFDTDDVYAPYDVANPTPNPLGSSRTLASYFPRPDVRIMQSCNGLLLCCSDYRHKPSRMFFVFNPTTKQLETIPFPPSFPTESDIRMSLAFHPTECPHYKIVCVGTLEENYISQIQVFSSDTREWKISSEEFYSLSLSFVNGVYWNGAIHWPPCGGGSHWNLMCFHIESQQLQKLPLPKEVITPIIRTSYFGESRGHLHLIVNAEYSNHFCVFEMLRDRSGWFLKYRVQLNGLPPDFLEMIHVYAFGIMDVVRGETEEDTLVVVTANSILIKYNVHDKSFNYISSDHQWLITGWYEAHRYIQTVECLVICSFMSLHYVYAYYVKLVTLFW